MKRLHPSFSMSICLLICLFLISGCANKMLKGAIYTHVYLPVTKNLNRTPVGDKTAEGSIVQVKEPFSGYGFYTRLNSNAIGDIAAKNGIKTVYFADVEIFSVLGIWTYEKVHIYGE